MKTQMSRRNFLATSSVLAGTALLNPMLTPEVAAAVKPAANKSKVKVALIGTGSRGSGMWGRELVQTYPDYMEFVGLCDKNQGRVETGERRKL